MSLVFTQKGLSARNTAAETTYAISPTAGQTVAQGSLAVLFCAYDNSGTSGADPFSSISDSLGNTWTSRFAPLNDPGAASAGAAMRAFTCRVARPITSTDVITISFGSFVTVARCFVLWECTSGVAGGYAAYVTGNSGTASSTTVSIVTGTIPVGDATLASMGGEGNSLNTGDTDTLNGSWTAVQTTAVGTTTSGIQIQSQNKIQTTTPSAQTYNPTVGTSEDLCAIWLQIHEVVPAYAHSTTVTIDHTRVGGTDSTDFPMLVDITQAVLKTVANGGQVQSASGLDIGFYSNVGLTARLSWDIETYGATTGRVLAHVKIPTLSHTTNTVIYLAWGDANITDDISTSIGVWSNSFVGVYHMDDNAATTAVADETNINPGVSGRATNVVSSPGEIATSLTFTGSGGPDVVTLPNVTSLSFERTDSFSVSCWLKRVYGTTFAGSIAAKGLDPAVDSSRGWRIYSETDTGFTYNANGIYVQLVNSTGTSNAIIRSFPASLSSTTTWYHVFVTYDGSSTAAGVKCYVNGQPVAGTTQLDTLSATILEPTYAPEIGRDRNAEYFVGNLDEFRFAKSVVRSADWVTAEYSNQSDPGNFAILGNAPLAPRPFVHLQAAARAAYF